MISRSEIKRTAAKNKIMSHVVERDYILGWILYGFSQMPDFSQHFVFKGGTALRKIYFSNWRYSEDLDFTVNRIFSKNQLNTLLTNMQKIVFEETGIVIETFSLYLSPESKPEYCQIKLQYTGPFESKSKIKIDLSFNELLCDPPVKSTVIPLYSDNMETDIPVYCLEEILAEKMRSILQRGKTRDYYDVWQILKISELDISASKVREIFSAKCNYKDITLVTSDDFFSDEKISNASIHWEKSLSHQLNDLPDFRIIIEEMKPALKTLLNHS